MTAAQKKAQDNFKKAIAYRKKTGCTLKQAFAHVKGGKVSGLDKVVKKGSKTTVLYTKKAKKKAAKKVGSVKKKAAKKPSEKAILKKVHSAKTTSKTLFNKLDKLDEAQHKHMGATKHLNIDILNKIKKVDEDILLNYKFWNDYINAKEWAKRNKNKAAFIQYSKIDIPRIKKLISELKKHKTELKKLL